MGRGDIAEGLHELAAIHHKGLVEFIQHLSDFAHQQIRDRTHPGGSWASSKKRVSIWRVVSVGALGICQLWPSASSYAPSSTSPFPKSVTYVYVWGISSLPTTDTVLPFSRGGMIQSPKMPCEPAPGP